MKISHSWLEDYIKVSLSVEEVSELLTDLGLEVEKVVSQDTRENVFKGVVVGKILTCNQHPNADRLNLTMVDVGFENPLQIVCGAPNVVSGQKVPVATIGTRLSSEGGEFRIKKSKIRGIESMGMICSEVELGIGQEASGIMVLDKMVEVGKPLRDVLDVRADVIYEIGITPNRSDALSHYGVARDLKAGLVQRRKDFNFFPFEENFKLESNKPDLAIKILDLKAVTRYCAIQIDEVQIGDSPDWLKEKLLAVGLSSINNVIDVLNYVMFDLGQPFHAFDLKKIKGSVCVGCHEQGRSIVTLDGKSRNLSSKDILIFDSEKTLCIAGIYGGIESSVTLDTNSILIEAAVFDSKKIRQTSKRHGLFSDSSFRFEREVDPNMTLNCLERAVRLICEISKGVIVSNVFDHYPKKKMPFEVSLSLSKLNDFSGIVFDRVTVEQILSSLEIEFKGTDIEDVLQLLVPTYRADVTREVDIFEEILRVYGYNRVKEDKNIEVPLETKKDGKSLLSLKSAITGFFVDLGFYEIMTNSLTNEANLFADVRPVKLLNPLSAELSYMRTSLIQSGLEAISYNIRRQERNLKFFEFGNQYSLTTSDTYREEAMLSILVTGKIAEGWDNSKDKIDLFYLKGILEGLLLKLGLSFYKISQDSSTSLSFFVGRDLLLRLQQTPKTLIEQFDIKQDVISAILDLSVLSKLISRKRKKIKPVSKFPFVIRDLSMILPNQISFQEIIDLVNQVEKEKLQDIKIFDVYKGKNIPKGKKSYAVSFKLQDQNKTLEDEEIENIMSRIQSILEDKLSGIEIRKG